VGIWFGVEAEEVVVTASLKERVAGRGVGGGKGEETKNRDRRAGQLWGGNVLKCRAEGRKRQEKGGEGNENRSPREPMHPWRSVWP
jgi:hypothetical protein